MVVISDENSFLTKRGHSSTLPDVSTLDENVKGPTTLTERGMLAALYDHGARSSKTIDVTYATLASRYDISERTVRRHLRRLHDLGYITLQTGHGAAPTRVRLRD